MWPNARRYRLTLALAFCAAPYRLSFARTFLLKLLFGAPPLSFLRYSHGTAMSVGSWRDMHR